MHKFTTYNADDKMSEVITENFMMLNILSRFAMPLGTGQKTIKQFCKQNNVDTNTFLQIINLATDDSDANIVDAELHFPSILRFLENSHHYFIEFRLPMIGTKLQNALRNQSPVVMKSIMDYFNEYFREVKKHFNYEERKVFPYITSLINNTPNDKYNISIFSRQHDHVEVKLMELKNILIQYYPLQTSYELNDVLFNIFICADDLRLHNDIEDRLLVPSIKEIEQKTLSK
ncbi:MAG: hemerythrin domain-containing protein [Bacteroidales bacterium]|jgi:regulator of cell morphogenesis and NO signaling|nr:hemerythrin domain-containing protein [Bacteroidales bacterium]